MITNTSKTIIVDGVKNAALGLKRNNTGNSETDVIGSLAYVADGRGGCLGAGSIVITSEIKGYFIKPILLYEAAVYNITGVVTPGDMLVYISSGFEEGSIDALKNNIIACAYADKEGNFSFNNIAYPDGTISLWVNTLAQEATTASLTYELSLVDYDPNIGNLLTYSFSKLKSEGEYENPLYIIDGTCTEDIKTVYLSKADNAMSITYLMETMCKSITPIDGTFKIEHGGEYDQNYIVWGLSKIDGTLTVENIKIANNRVCLSGDTMITMADGSVKRMDNMYVGDLVLSKDGISRVNNVEHGCFNKYHTLYHFEDGTIIDETHHHRFYNTDQGFWQRLQLWNIGDHAINQEGKEIALVSVERLEEKAEMFGIWTDSGTYYANGLLSGAASCNKELLAEATAEQAIDMMLSTDEESLIDLMGLGGVLP